MSEKLDSATVRRLKDRPYYAYLYARNITKARLPGKLERVFARDPKAAYLYAKHILHGRLPDYVHNGLILSTFEDKEDQEYLASYINDFCKE